jgi:ubiquinone/menaquinone biosynthesis C-methylase UbiE
MISHAKKNLPTGHFIHKDMTQVTLENNYYDAILSFYSLFVLELKNQFLMFEKMYNALKPGGIVYFTLLTKTYTKQDEFETIMEFLGHNLYFAQTTSDKYENQLMKIGFINIKMEELMIGEDETCLWVYSEKSI